MTDKTNLKTEIQKDIRDLAEVLNLLASKYRDEPLLDDAQKAFLSLSVHTGKALDIQLQ